MKSPRIVLDTNVVVSAALTPGGLEARVVQLVAGRMLTLCVSSEVLNEYTEVLARPRFSQLDPTQVARLLSLIADRSTHVTPIGGLSISSDEPDNRFLECAEAAKADYLVTGNKRHFPSRWKSTRVVNARELLESVALES